MNKGLNKPEDDGTYIGEYQIVLEWLSMAQPLDIVKAIAEAEGFRGTVNELYRLSNKKTASVANDLEHAIECLVEAINDQHDADKEI